jgi:tetratricopeptide (TPR) repeat protein
MANASRIPALVPILLLALACGAEDPLEELRALHAVGRYEESIAPLRRLLDRDPTLVEANLLLGRALLQTGQAGLAVWPLGKARESPQYAVEASMLLARAMLEGRSPHDAVAAIERVLELEPENVEALTIRAEAYMDTGQMKEARADLERVLELDPDFLGALVPRVLVLISLDEIEEAARALDEARKRFESAGPDVPPSLRARLCIALGLFAFERGETEVAEAQYAECLEKFPTEPLAVTETAAHYQRTGRAEEATEILRRAYEETRSTTFRVALAHRMAALGNPEEQERLLREEAEERPSWPAWFTLADLYVRREAYAEAIDAFERALGESASPNPKLLFAYADTLAEAGHYERAQEIAQQIGPPELRQLIRGRLLLAQGDAEGALRAFEAGIRLWPNNPGGRFLAGQAAERVGDFERASSHYRESLRAGAEQSEAGLALAALYEARGDLSDALDAAGRYVRTHPEDPEGFLVTIRIAHALEHHDLAASGIERLALLPGQAPRALAVEAQLVAERAGPEGAIEAIDRSELDLTDPENAPALRELLAQLAARGDHERAEREIAAALEAHPQAAVFHELRGRALRAAGAPAAAARAAFERAGELDPGDAAALSALAELAVEAGDLEAALAGFERAAEADPADPAPALRAAELLRAAGQAQTAQEHLARLLERHPRDGAAAIALARILEEQGDRDGAADWARRAAWLGVPEAEAMLERIRGAAPPAGPATQERGSPVG